MAGGPGARQRGAGRTGGDATGGAAEEVRALVVTATDTGVGKTVVTAALALGLTARGLDVGIVKPIQSGAVVDDPAGDAAVLARLTGLAEGAARVCSYGFAPPLAPSLAAGAGGPSSVELIEASRAVIDRHELTLVEGAGGLLVPLAGRFTVADLAGELEAPLIVVARPGLGTVNHTWLTVEAARARGLAVAGVVLNGVRRETTDPSEPFNPAMIEELAGVPVLGRTPWLEHGPSREALLAQLVPTLDLDVLLALARPGKPAR